MKAAVISLGSISSKWTIKEMKKYFKVVDNLNIKKVEINLGAKEFEVLYDGKPLDNYDCIYAKGSFRYVNLLRSLTAALETTTYMPIRSESFTIGHDKLLTHLKLQTAGVPMPKTYISSTVDAAKKLLKKINYPIVMKFPHGTHGKGVMFSDSYDSASSVLDALTALRQPFLLQEFVDVGGSDIRAIVVGDEVPAAMVRKAVHGEKRANIHAGGSGEPIELDATHKKIAIDTAKAIGSEICAVDILMTEKGPLVIEANLSPGLQGITKMTNQNVAEKIAKFLAGKTKEAKASKTKVTASEILEQLSVENGNKDTTKEFISNLDFRGQRILLPDILTKITKFKDEDDIQIKAKKGKLLLKKFKVQ